MNPADRLRHQLQLLAAQRKDATAIAGLCGMWGLDETSTGHQMEVLRRMGDMVEMGQLIRNEGPRLPFGPVAIMDFEGVEETLFNFLMARSHPLDQVLQPMTPLAWRSLDQMVEVFAGASPPLELEPAATDGLLTQVAKLIDSLRTEASLTDDQRQTVLAHLLNVQQTLQRVQIVGPARVEQAGDGLMGALVRLSIKSQSFRQHPVVAESLKLIGAISVVLGVSADWNSLTAGGIAALAINPGGSADGDAGGDGGGGSL